jgi:hypothetical protein
VTDFYYCLIEQISDKCKLPNFHKVDKHYTQLVNRYMNKYLVVMAAMVAMLAAATVITTDNAFADKSQAVSQVNDCGNGDSPTNVFCQNLASQIQGDGNAAALTGEQD